MKVYVVSKSLSSDPLEIDSIWSAYELADARVREFDNDEYYQICGSFMIVQWTLDSTNAG